MGALVRSGRHDRRGMGYVVMTFDPTRPCRYRNGVNIVQLVKIVRPLDRGETWMALGENGEATFHYDDGRYFQTEDVDMDLVNIPEEVEVVRWAVFDRATGDYMMRSYSSEQQAIENAKSSQVVVRLTGRYKR